MDFFSNPWVIGIGGGILSGIIVTIITRFIFNKKDNGVYNRNLMMGNNEVIYALRPTISENYFPDKDIISALIEANARKYKVNSSDLHGVKQIAEELTKEIMDSSFISYEKKEVLFKHLISLYQEDNKEVVQHRVEENEAYTESRKRLINMMTATIGMMVSVMTLVFIVYPEFDTFVTFGSSIYERLFIPLLIISLMVTMLMFTQLTLKKIQSKKKEEVKGEE